MPMVNCRHTFFTRTRVSKSRLPQWRRDLVKTVGLKTTTAEPLADGLSPSSLMLEREQQTSLYFWLPRISRVRLIGISPYRPQ